MIFGPLHPWALDVILIVWVLMLMGAGVFACSVYHYFKDK